MFFVSLWLRLLLRSSRRCDRDPRDLADAALREPQVPVLVDLHVAHGASAARDRPRQEFLRLGKEGPYPNVTGGFGEQSCHLYHLDNPINAPGGTLTVEGVPQAFVPGDK